jgi:hypothetical protein
MGEIIDNTTYELVEGEKGRGHTCSGCEGLKNNARLCSRFGWGMYTWETSSMVWRKKNG